MHELIDLTSMSPVSYQSGIAGGGKMTLERMGGLGDGDITIANGGRGGMVLILPLVSVSEKSTHNIQL